MFAKKKQIVPYVSETLGISTRTIYRVLDEKKHTVIPVNQTACHIMIIMDCVYFRRVCCYLVIRNWYQKKNIFFKRIPYETIDDYITAIEFLESQRFIIDGIVVDGRKGVFEALSGKYPIQMCQFHQKQIVRRYITNSPQTPAGIELKEIVKELPSCDREWFELLLDVWEFKYGKFIKERTVDSVTHRWFYTHKRLRSAYRSLRKNIPYLFTYQSVKNMPNTTNSLDGFFAHLKDAVSIHRGLKLRRRTKLIEDLIVS
ncbi:MAG: hypothetical protein M1342_03660 [Patescibacteria group bacterium]|nr:hypothetical protein [Patescibacteria group bacterium]